MSSNSDQSSKTYYTLKFRSIKKLSNTNYAVWKDDITVILQAKGAYAIINGEEEVPAFDNTAAAKTTTANYQK